MCGIVGAVAQCDVTELLLGSLKRLEYRGYDSAGLAILHPDSSAIQRTRVKGKVSALSDSLKKHHISGHVGIAHTRWATHGKPTQKNAHPHTSTQEIAIVHNGIIENYIPLREQLISAGYSFESETDTEVVAHLLHYYSQREKNFLAAIHKVSRELIGAYALGIITIKEPHSLFVVREGSPLVIGLGKNANYIASDPLALLSETRRFIYLEEGDIACLQSKEIKIYDNDLREVKRKIHTLKTDPNHVTKGKFQHYMQKEIFEQPKAVLDTFEGHLINGAISTQSLGYKAEKLLKQIRRIKIVACGTSYHAALIGRYWLEAIAEIPCTVEIASEDRYRECVVEPHTLFIALSQSGETADTLEALRQAKKAGYQATMAICNVAESSLVREADLVFLTRAGTEIGVAATKTFTTQLIALFLLTLLFKQHTQTNKDLTKKIVEQLQKLPNLLQKILKLDDLIKKIAENFKEKAHALFLGRGALFPVALEGALKLKEISYMHAEAHPAGELKHGPLALVDHNMPVIVTVPKDHLTAKLCSNIQEVQAREGELYIFIDEDIDWKSKNNEHTTLIPMPKVPDFMAPIAYTIPLQLLAYHVAALKGTDIDHPRNLAKSVTVE